YDLDRFRERIRTFEDALADVPHLTCYAVKANDALALLDVVAAEGLGADVVSGGELAKCLQVGIPPRTIVFSGVGKREDEIRAAVEAGIRSLNVESLDELGRELERAGIRLEDFDAGGGLGIPYDGAAEPDLPAYVDSLAEIAGGLDATLILEPGRHLAGPVGTFVTRVLHVKQAGGRTIAVCDGGSNDLLRPALYGAEHPIAVLAGDDREETQVD